jgi:hypothetical protein
MLMREAAMIPGASASLTLAPANRGVMRLRGSLVSYVGEMPDRAALIEEQILGLRRFAHALLAPTAS